MHVHHHDLDESRAPCPSKGPMQLRGSQIQRQALPPLLVVSPKIVWLNAKRGAVAVLAVAMAGFLAVLEGLAAGSIVALALVLLSSIFFYVFS